MLDVVFVAVTLIFFALSVGYVGLCDRLRPEPRRARRRGRNEK